jgi:HEAT repeat protein
LFLEYQVPRKIGKRWIDDEKLLPLLDGLDEVKEIARNTCVEVINAFRSQYRSVDLVVCSRIADYDLLTTKLNLQCAFVLQPLSSIEIDHFLAHSDFAALREAIKSDSKLREMAATPFLLNTLMYTYRQAKTSDVEHFQNEEERRTDLFNKYIFKSFHQQPQNRYTLAQTKQWLCWLASKMVDYRQTVFYIESLQPSWLAPKGYRSLMSWKFDLTTVFVVAIIVSLICACVGSIFVFAAFTLNLPLDGVIAGAIFSGIVVGLTAGNERIDIAESVKWSLSRSSLLIMMAGRLANISVFAGIGFIIGDLIDIQLGTQNWWFTVTAFGAFLGFISSFIFELPIGLRTSESMEMRTRPNQGIWLSTLNVLKVTSTGGVFVGMILGLLIGVILEFSFQLTGTGVNGFILGFPFGLTVGIGGGLATGGIDAIIKHLMLRVALTYSAYTPLNYARFLDFCASLGLLRKVGGGYIFQHRILLEYFAWLWGDAVGVQGNEVGDGFEALIAALHDKSWVKRCDAAESLGKLGDERAVEPLIALLNDEVPNVRRMVAWSLGVISDDRAVEPLIAALNDGVPNVRRVSVEALATTGDERVVEPLIATLRDPELNVRRSAAVALGRTGDERAVQPLITLLNDEDWRVRDDAVLSLGEIGDERAVQPLITLLNDKDWDLQSDVALLLDEISDDQAVKILIVLLRENPWSWTLWCIIQALGKIGDKRIIPTLIVLIKDNNEDVSSSAIACLERIGTEQALDVLHRWRAKE